jgi:methionine--tRNA ligase beta chain
MESEASIEDFEKMEIRIGEIKEADKIEGSEKLLRLQVDFGDFQRQCIAGIQKHYSPDELVGRRFAFVTNLKPRKMMGLESQCMFLAASDAEGRLSGLNPEKEVSLGSRIH